ncbi:mucin-2-like [Dorcoceras hygrometricum]|uniref:Mucin-2-like n=1 Tax=Dorcoceras hygrometricum TaxID=472368 RepID=A0A2Z7C2N5_9LAMI|nr:mucin-2-like [Dorcoceras hygrometricum]
MGATHSSQHTAPDETHGSTCCCPTHEVWELPTPPIVANRSQQGDEVRELPAQPQQHPGKLRISACYGTCRDGLHVQISRGYRVARILEGTTHVFESAVTEFFSNARVIAGTIVSTVCGQKLVVTEEIFSATFKLPTEGMANFSGIQKETIAEMKHRFSATEVPFKISGKKRELHFEYRFLHDIVAKSLCTNAGSFDSVTCENSSSWSQFLRNPEKQSQGYIVPVSMLMEILVKDDLGTSIKLHAKKMLTSKQVAPKGETNSVQRTQQVTLRAGRHKVHSHTNQYNQDLELIHSTNGNHLESPKEGSSIDHQVTIHLHAQNITMFPTNETWYFKSQMLVSSSGGLILILTVQSTRNVFRIHSDY